MRIAYLLALLIACCAVEPTITQRDAKPATEVIDMMDSTVQIHVKVHQTQVGESSSPFDPLDAGVACGLDGGTLPAAPVTSEKSWVGSGVIVSKANGKSLILSAAHVLDTPTIGSYESEGSTFLGMKVPFGGKVMRNDSIEMWITTSTSVRCDLKVLSVSSDQDNRDLATAVAACDAGPVAKIASAMPIRGQKVFIVGYSRGESVPIVTEGWYSGINDSDYPVISAAAAGGNSGGPVFWHGQVVGILVRVRVDFDHVSLMTPLDEIVRRIHDTPKWE